MYVNLIPPALSLALVRDVVYRQAGIFFFLALQMIDQTCHPWLGFQEKKDGRLMRRDAVQASLRMTSDLVVCYHVSLMYCTADELIKAAS